ncbi:MAG: response regulator [Desulfuromonas sp.]|nr:response regulator [Desulfuromonas sp.]
MLSSVLIVDDSPVARMIMKKCLPANHGLTVYEAGDGKQGVKQYLKQCPDLTFLDLTMPVMDGFQALTEIKKNNPKAIVIVVTADVQEKVLQRVAALGALHTVKKPPSKATILDALQQATAALEIQESS